MRGDRMFTCQSCFFFTRRFKKCWQLFDSSLTPNRPFAQLLNWVRDGASGDGRSVTCTWIATRTARNGDKKSTSRPSETLKLHVGDWPTVTGCPVSNPGNNCANGLLTDNGGSERFVRSVGLFPIVRVQTSIDGRGYMYSSTNKAAWKSFDVEVWWACLHFIVRFRAFSLSSDQLEWATKVQHKKKQPKETRWLASTGLLQGSNAGLVRHWAIRLDEPET